MALCIQEQVTTSWQNNIPDSDGFETCLQGPQIDKRNRSDTVSTANFDKHDGKRHKLGYTRVDSIFMTIVQEKSLNSMIFVLICMGCGMEMDAAAQPLPTGVGRPDFTENSSACPLGRGPLQAPSLLNLGLSFVAEMYYS